MSVNLEGLVPVRTLRMGGQVDWDDPIQIPNGLAIVCQNMQFLAESVKVRWGMRNAMVQGGYMADASGVDVLTVLGSPSPPKVNQKVLAWIRAYKEYLVVCHRTKNRKERKERRRKTWR